MIVVVIVPVMVIVRTVGGAGITAMIVVVTIGVRMPPEHELFDDEEHSETDEQRGADASRTLYSNTLDRLRKERKQRGPEQSACCITDEVRHEPAAERIRYEKEQSRERCAGDAADGGKEDDPGEQGQRALRFF